MYIVTGGAGFIGSNLVARLNAEGITDIIIVDNLGNGEKWRNLVGKTFEDYIHKDQFLKLVLQGSLRAKPQAIIHLGACSSTLETNAEYMIDNNYRYSGTLAEWCLSNKVRFIYASSAATYGDGALGFSDDDEIAPKLRPLNIYGYSKQLFDLWALQTGAAKKITGFKFFNVFGPNEYHKNEMRSVVLKAFEQITQTGKVQLFKSYRSDYKNGMQSRDFVYVKDCIDLLWWAIQKSSVHGIFNLGSGHTRTWKDLATAVFTAMGKEPLIDFIDMPETQRPRYQYFTEAKMEKVYAVGCDVKFRSLEQGVTDYVQHYLLKPDRYL